MSKHRSPRPFPRTRTRAALILAVSLSLTGAAYTAHAAFGRAHLGNGHTVTWDEAATAPAPSFVYKPTVGPSWHTTGPTSGPTSGLTQSPATTATSPTSGSVSASTSQPPTGPSSGPTTSSTATPSGSPSSSPSGAHAFPGYVPGRFYLGMSCGTACTTQQSKLGQPYGVHRQYKEWGNWKGLANAIASDHQAGRLPWVSVKGPSSGSPAGWQALAAGQYDSDIAALAATLKANDSKPVFLTFDHEPSNDGTDAQGAYWAAAYCHLHDLLAKAGALQNVADPPILGDWLFNDHNSQDPANWLTKGVMQRMPFLGIDMYENASGETFGDRIPAIIGWMAQHGFPNEMVGIGETGATDYYRSTTAVKWLNASLGWAASHTDQVVAVSYFNSTANSRRGVYWPLDETAAKMAAYRSWLGDAATIN